MLQDLVVAEITKSTASGLAQPPNSEVLKTPSYKHWEGDRALPIYDML